MRPALLAACGGFLVAVVWMDLMFDVQTLGIGVAAGTSSDVIVASIAAYYRRVTTDAHPMNQLIGLVMATAVAGAGMETRTRASGMLRWVALALCVGPIALAAVRVFPNAARLGSQLEPPDVQLALARAICRDHLMCFLAILGFTATQVLALRRSSRPPA